MSGLRRWRLDLALPAAERSDDWIHRQTALLLAQPAVRAAFELPEGRGASPVDSAEKDASLGIGSAVAPSASGGAERCEVLM